MAACTGTEFNVPPIDTQPDAGPNGPSNDAGHAGNDAGDADAGPQQYFVTTVAGTGEASSVDTQTTTAVGPGAAVLPTFNGPTGIAVAPDGSLYVADYYNNKIRKISADGTVVSTYAGTSTAIENVTWKDGDCTTQATFNGPIGIAIDTKGIVYVADTVSNAIRKITNDAVNGCQVSTLASPASDPNFPRPGGGLTVDADGNVYFSDYDKNTIRKIVTNGEVVTTTIFAGIPGTVGADNGPAASATFNCPAGIVVDKTNTFYVLEQCGNDIRKIAPDAVNTVSTLAGLPNQAVGFIDGTGEHAAFNTPFGLAIDASGTLYVADSLNHAIRKVSPFGEVTTLAGLRDAAGNGMSGHADGQADKATFWSPAGVAVDSSGVVYVADTGNNMIRKIAPAP